MKCQHAQYMISKLIDGEVSPSSREQLRQHVRACEGCDKTYKRLFALESLLDESFEPFRHVRFPGDFNQRILERIEREERQPARLPRLVARPVFAGLAGAGALAAVAGLLLWRAQISPHTPFSAPRRIATNSPVGTAGKLPGREVQALSGRRLAGALWQVIGSSQVGGFREDSVKGQSSLESLHEETRMEPAKRGLLLRPGTVLRTGKTSRAKVGFTDGTVLKLNANTVLAFAPDRLRLVRGELWAKVAKSKTPFLIKTPRGLVKVVGTVFNLRSLERKDVLSVFKGRVLLRTPRVEVPCEAGQQAVLLSGKAPEVSSLTDQREVVAWTDFQEAERLYAAAQFQQAKQVYRQVVQVQPENLTAQRRLFDTLERTAEVSIEIVGADTASSSEVAQAQPLYRYALRSQAQKDLKASLAAVNGVVRKEPQNAKAQALLGYLLLAQNETDKALPHLKAAIQIEPHPAEAHFSLAYVALNEGDMETAKVQIDEGLKRDERSALGHALRGVTLRLQGLGDASAEAFQRALRLDPSDPIYHVNVAEAYRRSGKGPEAIQEYAAAADLAPASGYCVQKLVDMYLQLGQVDQAIEHLKHLRLRAPENDRIPYGLGRAYQARGNDMMAELSFREATRLNSQNPDPYLLLSDVYLKGNDYDSAAQTVLEALRQWPGSAELLQQARRVLEEAPPDLSDSLRTRLNAVAQPLTQYPVLGLYGLLSPRAVTVEDRQQVEDGIAAFREGKTQQAMQTASLLCQRLNLGSWVSLGSQPEERGLRQIVTSPEVMGDGLTREEEVEGYRCVRTMVAEGKFYVYFDVEQSSTKAWDEGAYLILCYFDSPAGAMRVEYDSTSPQGQCKRTSSVRKIGSRSWRYHVWSLKDARFGGRQNGGADFRVVSTGGQDSFLRWACVVPAAELQR
ncbi:MAG: tetratricopeptide repeat protein [Armatimonadetes bacterium]|nr:tetratricopeptide repeat protein [Armatimonadota bacterium]